MSHKLAYLKYMQMGNNWANGAPKGVLVNEKVMKR